MNDKSRMIFEKTIKFDISEFYIENFEEIFETN